MGNTHVRKETNQTDSRRSQFFAVLLRKNSEIASTSKTKRKSAQGYSFIESGPVTRRMAIFGEDYEKSKVEKVNTVNLDFIYQIPKSTLIVNPFDGRLEEDYVTIERSIHGKDDERVFKSVLEDIFKPTRKCRSLKN